MLSSIRSQSSIALHGISNVYLILTFQDEDMKEGRFNFSGYTMGPCLPMKDGNAMKSATPNAAPVAPTQRDIDIIKKKFVDRAKRIDTVSRAAFPLAFLIFNIFYWITYKIIRHEA